MLYAFILIFIFGQELRSFIRFRDLVIIRETLSCVDLPRENKTRNDGVSIKILVYLCCIVVCRRWKLKVIISFESSDFYFNMYTTESVVFLFFYIFLHSDEGGCYRFSREHDNFNAIYACIVINFRFFFCCFFTIKSRPPCIHLYTY